MSRWVRLWEDMPNDPKWLVVKARALQKVSPVTVGEIICVFVHMLTKADQNGELINWCDEDVAAAIECETGKVTAIRESMDGKVLDGNRLKSWGKRQPNGGDYSTERVRAFRERRRELQLTETLGNDGNGQKRRESEDISFLEKKKQKTRAREGNSNFVDFWERYPHKVGKADARKAFDVALSRGEFAVIMVGLARYIQTKPADRPWCNPGTWLRQDRWLDQPAPALGAGPASNGHDASRPRPAPGPPGETLEQRTDRWRKWQEENP
jgi:hypothetical protein